MPIRIFWYTQLHVGEKEDRRVREVAKKLKDTNAKAHINLRIMRISLTGSMGDCKPVGEGVSELRIDYDPGYRVYFGKQRSEMILLPIGGDKSIQQRDIAKAKQLNKEYEQEEGEDDGREEGE